MEVDSGAERSTVPLSIFQQKLADVCTYSLRESHSNNMKSSLTVEGEWQAKVKINNHVIHTTFVVVDVEKQLPLLGRDWMSLLQFDVTPLMERVT